MPGGLGLVAEGDDEPERGVPAEGGAAGDDDVGRGESVDGEPCGAGEEEAAAPIERRGEDNVSIQQGRIKASCQ